MRVMFSWHAYTTPMSAHVSAARSLGPSRTWKEKRPGRVNCSSFHQNKGQSRRAVSIAFLICHWFSNSYHANADSPFDKYVKRKKLDPLESYVPAVLLTQLQFQDLEKTLEIDQPTYANCRSLLRSGPAASLRINIRAVAQYASDDGKGKTAFDAVDQCLRALEDLDSLLLNASRNDRTASVESMKAKIVVALDALDSLLQTVPSPVLDKGKAIADAYKELSDPVPEEGRLENLDPDMKQLESLL
eukprot:TRINITY_DN10992_c0_g1_i1.p1 TRINITY_DN10992_c0_g1~~TRINITY_DN10992_c0_g1_i1.p1  ORF type:complete len:245 (-),score=18.49 TRINITY_DN10992_c0_g1_i1:146-880(-)